MIEKEQMRIVTHRRLATDIYEMVLQGALVQKMVQPGQFVHVKVAEGNIPLLRRPISICRIDREKSEFTILYRAAGRGTRILSQKAVGTTVDVLGPLGNGFPIEAVEAGQTACLVGGGIGVPPLYELANQLVAKGVRVIHVLGFQNKDSMFYEEQFGALGETHIATVDGSYGTKGFVTDVLTEKQITWDTLYTCGPTPMLRALLERYGHTNMYVSLEERMGCGIGACFACVCPTADSYKKICSDGPVFRAGEVLL